MKRVAQAPGKPVTAWQSHDHRADVDQSELADGIMRTPMQTADSGQVRDACVLLGQLAPGMRRPEPAAERFIGVMGGRQS
jgi:hypothetical protein